MKLVYIIGSYRSNTVHGIVENIREAEKYMILLLKKGYAVICPHKNTALLDGTVPDEVFLEMDLEILRRCDFAFVLPGSENSIGSQNEIKFCASENILILDNDILLETIP